MKKMLLAAAALSLVTISAASAQVVERVWDKGGVWIVNRIDVKPGQYNAYIKYWRDVVLPRIEHGKKNGHVLGYHILNNTNPRDGEPDLYVMVNYKDMAAIDQPISYFEDMDRKLAGSLEGRQKQTAQARDLADFKGTTLLGEVVLTK